MFPYPDKIPADEITRVVASLRAHQISVSDDVHAAWAVLGYGLGQSLPPSTQLRNPVPVSTLFAGGAEGEAPAQHPAQNPERLADQLMGLTRQGHQPSTVNINWPAILPLLLQLLQAALSSGS